MNYKDVTRKNVEVLVRRRRTVGKTDWIVLLGDTTVKDTW